MIGNKYDWIIFILLIILFHSIPFLNNPFVILLKNKYKPIDLYFYNRPLFFFNFPCPSIETRFSIENLRKPRIVQQVEPGISPPTRQNPIFLQPCSSSTSVSTDTGDILASFIIRCCRSTMSNKSVLGHPLYTPTCPPVPFYWPDSDTLHAVGKPLSPVQRS